MYTLTYQSQEKEFQETVTVKEIRETFKIPARKNLYRKSPEGQLQKLSDSNLRETMQARDELEALSDFTMGMAGVSRRQWN